MYLVTKVYHIKIIKLISYENHNWFFIIHLLDIERFLLRYKGNDVVFETQSIDNPGTRILQPLQSNHFNMII